MSVKIGRTPADSLSELSELEIRTDHFRHLLGHQLFGGLCRFRRGLDVGRVIGDFLRDFLPRGNGSQRAFRQLEVGTGHLHPLRFRLTVNLAFCNGILHQCLDTGSLLVLLFLLVGGKACRRCGQVCLQVPDGGVLFRR